MYRYLLPAVSLWGFSLAASAQELVKGKVIDKNNREPIGFCLVSIGADGKKTITDEEGNFEIRVPGDSNTLYVSSIGYRSASFDRRKSFAAGGVLKGAAMAERGGNGDARDQGNARQSKAYRKNDLPLELGLEKGPVDLREVVVTPQSNAASFHTISRIDLNMRPVNSAQDLMRLVPGLFLGAHQGGGIAEHIFLRGFDADHGTDVNVSVDGMPVNLVSHAHGQGFSDLHFLIPELVTNYDFGKGPYYAGHGDFTTAGYVGFQTCDVLDKNIAKVEGGQLHTGRVMAAVNLLSDRARQRGESAYLAGEVNYTDGPFSLPQDFSRLNLFGKYNVSLTPREKLTVTLSTYTSDWHSTGEIPERAVSEGLTGLFGYIDSAQGGNTSKTTAIARLSSVLSDRLRMTNQFYYARYFFILHYDDTFFAEDSVNGDQLRQRESRDLFGYNGKLTHRTSLGGHGTLSSEFGAGWQWNKIYGSELSHTIRENTVLNYIQYGDTRETGLNAYLDENWQSGKWLLNAGARLDYLYFGYRDKLNSPLPARSKWIASPKINLEYTASPTLQVYLKTGKGFHSNDAKVVVANQGKEVLPAAYGADLGLNWKPLPRLYLNAALWYLYLQQEFTYSGDDGTIGAGDKSRRQGIDLSARYQFAAWLFATVDLNLSKARDIQAAKGSNYLPLAVPFSSAGGLDFKFKNGFNGAVSYRFMADRPANADNSLVAKGYFVTDLTANYTRRRYEVGLEIQNLFNTRWREAQFEVESRLRGEAQAVDAVSFQSGTPFFARLKLAVFF